jgi:hypothetical protein
VIRSEDGVASAVHHLESLPRPGVTTSRARATRWKVDSTTPTRYAW